MTRRFFLLATVFLAIPALAQMHPSTVPTSPTLQAALTTQSFMPQQRSTGARPARFPQVAHVLRTQGKCI
jgi:hypothetical protein